ncbi:hypothetical protein NDU88_002468 [Pleurodeles waltl]|uniref:Uncharacterized protein n=1 Tax=Pleurodeles waltl TaxID=8319 RepID=A0AAV7SFC1_PLEWA|nr:hypothetical protein NDU88_002468 [Pleurodeles waltl]
MGERGAGNILPGRRLDDGDQGPEGLHRHNIGVAMDPKDAKLDKILATTVDTIQDLGGNVEPISVELGLL